MKQRIAAVLILSTLLALATRAASTQTSRKGSAYAEKIEKLKERDKLSLTTIHNGDSYQLDLWRQGRMLVAVDQRLPIKPYQLKLPPIGSFNELAYMNGTRVYFSVVNPGEIRLFYEALARASFKCDQEIERSYYLANGTLAHEEIQAELPERHHFCDLGLFFLNAGRPIYNVSGHPNDPSFELRMSKEPDVSNRALNALLVQYTQESALWRAENPKKNSPKGRK